MKNEPAKQKSQLVKQLPPPLNLPLYGDYPFNEVTYLGRTNYFGGLEEKDFIFGIKRKDRKHHILVLGQEGVGKSKLLEGMIRQDLDSGFGAIVFDFHGDLFEALKRNIPRRRLYDVCLFDLSDISRLPAFNPLSGVREEMQAVFLEGWLKILRSYFGDGWNAVLENLWLMILSTILKIKELNNFSSIYALLNDKAYREKIISLLADEKLKYFWEKEYEQIASSNYENTVFCINVFLQKLMSIDNLKKFFSSPVSLVNIEELIQANKVVLVYLPYHFLGSTTSNFIKDLILLRVKMAGFLRAQSREEIKDFYIYLDDLECEANDLLEDILKFKGYHFSVTLAVKNLNNVGLSLGSKILEFFGSLIIFKLSNADAYKLEKELPTSNLKIREALSLGMQEFYTKLVINNAASEFFYGETLTLEEKSKEAVPLGELLSKTMRFSIPS